MAGRSFPKARRILRPADFERVRRRGRRFFTPSYVVYVLDNGLGVTRLGLSVSARTGGAVRRNRNKRLVREFFRLNYDRLVPSADILVSLRRGYRVASYDDAVRELGTVLFAGKARRPKG